MCKVVTRKKRIQLVRRRFLGIHSSAFLVSEEPHITMMRFPAWSLHFAAANHSYWFSELGFSIGDLVWKRVRFRAYHTADLSVFTLFRNYSSGLKLKMGTEVTP